MPEGGITYVDTAGGANFQRFFNEIIPQGSDELGFSVQYVVGSGPEIQQRLEAQTPGQGDIHVLLLKPDSLGNMIEAGIEFIPLTDHMDEIRNLELVAPEDLQEAFGVQTNGRAAPFWRDQFGILYDSARIENPPTSWQEFFDRREEWAGHIGMIRTDAKSGGGRLMMRDFLIGFGVDFSQPLEEIQASPEWEQATQKFTEFSEAFTTPLASEPTVLFQQFKEGQVWITEYAIDFTLWSRDQGLLPESVKATFFPSGHYGGAAYIAIPASIPDDKQQQAFAFVNWLLSVPAQVQMISEMWQYMGIEAWDSVPEEVWENIPPWEEVRDGRLPLTNLEAFNWLKENGMTLVAGGG